METKVISIYMFKGGVGKTTITSMLAFELSKIGKVLMIDADQQGNLSSTFMSNKELKESTDFLNCIENFVDEPSSTKSISEFCSKVREENKEDGFYGLYLLPTKKNDSKLKKYLETTSKEEPFALKNAMQNIVKKANEENFTYLLFDLPPSIGTYERIILSTATEIIPIIEPEKYAVESLKNFYKEIIEKLNLQFGLKLSLKQLIINKENLDKKAHQFYLENVKQSPFKEIFEIKESNAISSATTMQQTLQEYMPTHVICKTIEKLAESVK